MLIIRLVIALFFSCNFHFYFCTLTLLVTKLFSIFEHVESSGDRKEKPSSADRRTESPYTNNRESLSSQQPLTNKLMVSGELVTLSRDQ